jgi:hypothetical protein
MPYSDYSIPDPRTSVLRVVNDTMWFYPQTDVDAVLETTTIPYTFDGTHIVCPTNADITALYEAIFTQTVSEAFPGGYNIGVGSVALDSAKFIEFVLPSGAIVVRWTRAIVTRQQGGLAPVGTVGYVTTFYAGDNFVGSAIYDMTFMGRTG